MDIHFERGDQRQPKGHALVYFKNSQDVSQILATYIVVLPIPLELGKYLPPLLANQMSEISASAPSVVPMPPVPEQVESVAYLQRLADARDDDLIAAGSIAAGDLQRAIQETTDLAQRYLTLYNDFLSTIGKVEEAIRSAPEPELDVRSVIYSMMGEHDRLQELAKLTGQLRYAIEGGDAHLVADTVAEMERLGQYFPAKYRIPDFLRAAQAPGEQGRRLAALFMDRCYKLQQEDYAGLSRVETEIKELQGS